MACPRVSAGTLPRIAPTVINEIERGKRVPSLATGRRSARGWGNSLRPTLLRQSAAPADLAEANLRRLADINGALGITIPAVREGLLMIGDRLAAVGLRLI
jgi:hypothetical protein